MALISVRSHSSDGSNIFLILPSQNGTVTYNGSEQEPAWLNYDPAQLLISGVTEATNAGTYTAIFTPQGNCAWTDGTSNPKQVTWTITKAVPSLLATISEAVPYGETGIINVSGNFGGGVITATSDDDSVVDVQSATTNSVTVNCLTLSENNTTITITVAETANYLSGTTTCAVATTKADGAITLSADSGTVAYGTPGSFTVTNNVSGGTLSVTSSNSAYVDASVNGSTVTVTVVELGDSTQTITVTSAATANYNAASATYVVVTSTKATGTLTLSETSGTVTYGNPFTFTVTSNTSGGELSVSSTDTAYATASISDNTVTVNCIRYRAETTAITVTAAETATHSAATVTFTMTAARATGTISLSETSVTLNTSTPSATITVTTNSDGAITATSSDTSVCTASVNGTTVTINGSRSGSATVTVAVAEKNYTAMSEIVTVTITADISVDMLSSRILTEVQSIFQSGQGANYFKAGDYFDITFPNAITLDSGSIAADSTWRVVCLGIDHNSSIEGTNRGHFCIGKTTDDKEICFYGHQMNSTSTNSGGWNGCAIKTWLNETFYNALPADLQSVITECIKYTDNTGNASNTEGAVTSTSQKIWLMAEFEVFGSRTVANQYEQNLQAQYDYYKNGNSKIRYQHKNQESAAEWWLRSSYNGSNVGFLHVGSTGINNCGYYTAGSIYGVVPCFTIS